MALLFCEGFDKYGPANSNSAGVNALLTAGEWTASTITANIVAPLSATGQALSITGGGFNISKTLPANYSRLIGGFRLSNNLGSASCGVQFRDGASDQLGIQFNATGTFSVRNGNYLAGTVLGTSSATVTANTTHYLEFDITFGNVGVGSYQLWLDGGSILSGSGDTTATANAYANGFQFISGNAAVLMTVDDLYLFDSTGAINNSVLLTSPRVETSFPTSDGAVQFGFGAGILGSSVARVTGGAAVGTASSLVLRRFTPTANCTLNSISTISNVTAAGANLRPAVYADSSGTAGALLSSGATVTGMTTGVTITMPLTTPQALTAGTQYWLGVQIDGNQQLQQSDGSNAGYNRTGLTFASGAPNPAGTITAAASYLLWGNLTGISVNYDEANNQPPDGVYSYVLDSVVGHEDLYNFAPLSVPPSQVYAVAVKAYAAKSDAGTKTVSMRVKSGATDSGGSSTGQAMGTSFGWLTSLFERDPNGSIAWTGANVNAAQCGFRVDS